MSDSADWYVRNMRVSEPDFEISDDQRRCLNTLAAITAPSGLYNLQTPCSVTKAISLWPGGGVSVLVGASLATHDFDQLTNLVLAAHQNYVRVQIGPWSAHLDEERRHAVVDERNGYASEGWVPSDDDDECPDLWDVGSPEVGAGIMEIVLHARTAQADSSWGRHPGLDDLIKRAEHRQVSSPSLPWGKVLPHL